jgi:hypothetical protein
MFIVIFQPQKGRGNWASGMVGARAAKEALGFYLRSIEDRKASLEARLDVIERSDWPYQIKELCIRPLMLLKIERAWALGFIESIKEHERDKEERKGDA